MTLAVVITVLSLVLVTAYFVKNRKLYSLSWNLPGPRAIPLIGNALSFVCDNENIFKVATTILGNYSSPLRFWFGTKLTVVITDVYQAEKIMSSVKFSTKDEIYRFIEVIDGQSLITASGLKWKKDRRLMAPLFLKRNISQYFSCILDHTNLLVKILGEKVDQPTFDINIYIHSCVADFVNETVIGAKTNIQLGEMKELVHTIKRLYTLIHARMTKIWLQNDLLFKLSPYSREYNDGVTYIHSFLNKVLKENEKQHTLAETSDFIPIIHQLIDIRREITDFATDEEMVHHLATLYSAAEDTVQSIVSFTLVLLGMYPEVQEKVMKEIVNVLGEDRKSLEETDLGKLFYLDLVLKDVLRLFPIAPFIARKAGEDFQIDEHTIPKGCSIVVSIQSIHRDKRHWERPDEFYPEHFLPETVRGRHPYAFMPFSAGPRGCIGKAYAYMAMKIMIVTILRHFVIESDGKLQDRELKMDISIRFKDGNYPVRLKRRC